VPFLGAVRSSAVEASRAVAGARVMSRSQARSMYSSMHTAETP
jgi:hypothetical protein